MSSLNKPIISCTDISKHYDTVQVLSHINLSMQKGEKIGLVGPNGAGKTTLLRILAGLLNPDEGIVTTSKQLTVGYIPQEYRSSYDITVKEFIKEVSSISEESLSREFEKIRTQLNLPESILSRHMNQLSGGEKTKVALTRVLLASQDLLLLDEPTNNLDIEALTFLEDFVKKSSKTFLIISHDREFLDRTVTRIFEIDEFERNLYVYEGNYSTYIEERRLRLERAWEEYTDDQEKRGRLKETVDQKLRKADELDRMEAPDSDKFQFNFKIDRAKTANQRGAMLLKKRLESMDEVEKPKEPLPLNVRFFSDERSGDKVFELKDVTKELPHHILGPIDFTINYGDRLLITGSNGAGKTTLIKMLLGEIKPTTGTLFKGARLHIGYLPQSEDIIPEATVRDEFLRLTELEEGLGRRTLNRFKLTADDVEKRVSDLSSGERSRFILAVLMSKNVNCIILDEPSNHLDFEVLESLEEALKEFEGTIILVSHDRYFIKRLGEFKQLDLNKK